MQIGIPIGLNSQNSARGLRSIFGSSDVGQLLLPQVTGSVYSTSVGITSVTSGLAGLVLDQRWGTQTGSSMYLGLSLTPNYWIDDAAGNDANAGTSAGAAWQSLNKITDTLAGAGQTVVVRVITGTYDKAGDFIVITSGATGSRVIVVFEPGCIMDGTVANAVASQNPIYLGDTGTDVQLTIYGNGLIVQDYNSLSGGTPNGLGYGGVASLILTAYDVTIDNCIDGISGHGSGHGNFYRVTVNGNQGKATIANVDNSTMNAYQCSFTANDAATGGFCLSSAGLQYFEDSIFVPGAVAKTVSGEYQQFKRCRIGTTSVSANVQGRASFDPATSILIEDSYLNLDLQASPRYTIRRCYGLLSARCRAFTGQTFTVENCVLSGPATGVGSIVYSNFNPGAGLRWVFRNNIIETATAAAFMSVDATNAGYIVGEASQFFNNILSGSAAFDADLVTADSGATVRVSNVTADALIGAANTTAPADYGYASGSPAIGAATGGGNSGFSLTEATSIALVPASVRGPSGVTGYHALQATAGNRPTLSAAEIDFTGGKTLGTVFPNLGTNVTIAYANPTVGCTILTGQTVGAGTYSGYVDNNGWLMINRALTAAETAFVEREFDRLSGV